MDHTRERIRYRSPCTRFQANRISLSSICYVPGQITNYQRSSSLPRFILLSYQEPEVVVQILAKRPAIVSRPRIFRIHPYFYLDSSRLMRSSGGCCVDCYTATTRQVSLTTIRGLLQIWGRSRLYLETSSSP